jgi:hypothetical protein
MAPGTYFLFHIQTAKLLDCLTLGADRYYIRCHLGVVENMITAAPIFQSLSWSGTAYVARPIRLLSINQMPI